SMKVMRLLHAAVFMKAGSYVIIPNSSGVTLICRRSVALMVPSWIGISYCFPVRLSVIVSVSAMQCSIGALRRAARGSARPLGRFGIRILRLRLGGDAVSAREPPSQVGHLAALAAEGPPCRVRRILPAVDAQCVGGAQTS